MVYFDRKGSKQVATETRSRAVDSWEGRAPTKRIDRIRLILTSLPHPFAFFRTPPNQTNPDQQVVQHNFLSHRGYKISDDILLVPLARGDRDPVRRAGVLMMALALAFYGRGRRR